MIFGELRLYFQWQHVHVLLFSLIYIHVFPFVSFLLGIIEMSLSVAAQGLSNVHKNRSFSFGGLLFQVQIYPLASCPCYGHDTYFVDCCVRGNCLHQCDACLGFTDHMNRCRYFVQMSSMTKRNGLLISVLYFPVKGEDSRDQVLVNGWGVPPNLSKINPSKPAIHPMAKHISASNFVEQVWV